MAVEVRVVNTEDFIALSRALRKYGGRELKRELTTGITKATKPLKQAAKASARERLPSRGGLGRRVARTSLPHKQRTTGGHAGIRIEAKANAVADPFRIDRGRVAHPVFGRGPIVFQDVPPGWFTEPMQEGEGGVRKELLSTLERVANKIVRSI
jgi:hypothetical protein